MEENITVGKELEIVMTGVAALGTAGFVFPDDRSVGFADREDVFSVGSADKNEPVFFGKEGEGEKEEKSEELHDGRV